MFVNAFVSRVSQCLIAGTMVVGQAAAFSPNLQKGVIAAAKIIDLLKRVPKVQDPKDPQEFNTVLHISSTQSTGKHEA